MHQRQYLALLFFGMLFSLSLITSCFKPETIRFLDDGSGDYKVVFYNTVAQFIIENGFGHHVTYVISETKDAQAILTDKKVDVILFGSNAPLIGKDSNTMMAGDYMVRAELKEIIPDVLDFLTKMKLDDDTVADCLAWREANQTEVDNAVLYFLLNHQSKWKKWVTQQGYDSVKAEMNKQIEKSGIKDLF